MNIGDDDRIGVVETGAELVEQARQTGVAVRLDDGDDVSLEHFPRRLKDRGDLDGMVGVVVDDRDAACFPGTGKTPPHPGKAGQGVPHLVVVNAEFPGHRDGGERVGDVVAAPHRQVEVDQGSRRMCPAVSEHGIEAVTCPGEAQSGPAHIRLGAQSVGDDAAIRHPSDDSEWTSTSSMHSTAKP